MQTLLEDHFSAASGAGDGRIWRDVHTAREKIVPEVSKAGENVDCGAAVLSMRCSERSPDVCMEPHWWFVNEGAYEILTINSLLKGWINSELIGR